MIGPPWYQNCPVGFSLQSPWRGQGHVWWSRSRWLHLSGEMTLCGTCSLYTAFERSLLQCTCEWWHDCFGLCLRLSRLWNPGRDSRSIGEQVPPPVYATLTRDALLHAWIFFSITLDSLSEYGRVLCLVAISENVSWDMAVTGITETVQGRWLWRRGVAED